MGVITNKQNGICRKITAGGYASIAFSDIYHSLPRQAKAPKQAFVEDIAALCCCSQQTVRMWIQGVQRPDALKQKMISEHLGVNADVLFPAKV